VSASRFKFRYWDAELKKMDYDQRYCFAYIESPEPNIQVMQSTGLLDKNGVEIFEGDIIIDPTYGEGDVEYRSKFVVVFEQNPYCMGFIAKSIKSENSYEDLLGAFSKIQIIGNIYENPELLDKPNAL
jgi:uncharacterized phage protein (TIGR01671 family)